ncbi:hypothetical protein CYY_009808 [Polysphondylium violaceum]|uniref:U6 snRNA phosphodiesterase 1 n=1 Tax=Polysphondylium violaceum TaxID=133409 RepID=A0A8J4PMB0_9MYCE|nr:hypothetical protein CYY_009808 [Polysphondylium violaceum]
MNLLCQYEDEIEQDYQEIQPLQESKEKKDDKRKRITIEQEKVDKQDDDIPDPFFKKAKATFTQPAPSQDRNKDEKMRQFQHVEGNFPTFIFIKIPTDRQDIIDLVQEVNTLSDSVLNNDNEDHQVNLNIKQLKDYHISLSRTFPIREHQIESFSNEIKKSLSNQKKFFIQLESCNLFYNDNQSRVFLSMLPTQSSKSTLLDIIDRIDKCCLLFKFPLFYKDPEPHFSICWKSLINNNNNDDDDDDDGDNEDTETTTSTTATTDSSSKEILLKYKNNTTIKKKMDTIINPIIVNRIYWLVGKREYYIELT